MRNRRPISAETTIRAEDGQTYRVDHTTMLAAMDRARKYLEEAVRWSQERAAHMESGSEEDRDTRRHDRFLKRHGVHAEVWFPLDNEFTETDQMNVMATLHYWLEGELEDFEADYAELEEGLDLDPTYILFGIPIRLLSVDAQQELRRIGAAFAGRSTGAAAALN